MAAKWFTGIIRAALKPALEQRSSLENPQTPLSYPAEWLLDIFNGGRTDSGIRVSEMTALQVGTVLACVNIIGNGFASLPCHVYERTQVRGREAKKRAVDHTLYDFLRISPNEEMSSFTWRKTAMVHALLWGNSYTEIQRGASNQIVGLWPRNPARTRPIRLLRPLELEGTLHPIGTLIYETTESLLGSEPTLAENTDLHLGRRRLVLAEDMIHIVGLSLDGRLGQGTVWLARQIIGLALATEKYGAKFFGNGARPAGILEMPGKQEDKNIENMRRSWAEAHGGENQFKIAVLEPGIKFTKIASTPEEGQMLETRAYERGELCAIFNVPLHMVIQDKGTGKSNVEQASIEFVQYCLTPWVEAWEQELTRKLFPTMGRSANRFFPKFEKRQLLYPDADSRAKFYQSGKQWGYLNTNDIRDLEDMNPVDDDSGDLFMVQVNMQPANMPMTGGPGMEDHLTLQNELAPKPPAPQPAQPAQQQPQTEPKPGKPGKAGKKPSQKGAKGKNGKRSLATGGDVPVFVMRHGTTDANEQDLYRGWGEFKLDEKGVADAEKAAAYLKDKGIKHIITSSLERHQQTAGIVSRALGNVTIEKDDDLKTLNVGVYQGKKRSDYEDEVQWYLDHPDEQIPGGESFQDFAERNARAFAKVRAMNEMAGPTLVITSRSNIAALESAGVAGADVRVSEPGGVYRMDGQNNLVLVYGDAVTDSLAGT